MLSTTERRTSQRGQVLVIFAGGLVAILAIAALVFDVGQDLLERRRQQNAADAAALAGARFLTQTNDSISGLNCKSLSTLAACQQAEAAARSIAEKNGYKDGVGDVIVTVNIPPDSQSPQYMGYPGHVQVVIDTTRGSFFSGVLGLATHRVATQAVAANLDGYALPYSFLSLNPTACGAGKIGGGGSSGSLTIAAEIMVSSSCTTSPGSGALQVGGAGVTFSAPTCYTVGEHKVNGDPADAVCDYHDGATAIGDPLLSLNGPAIGGSTVPNPPATPEITGPPPASPIPNGCPGSSSPSTKTDPKGCDINFNKDRVVHIYPGVYWGGLSLRQTSKDLTVCMDPGIYYMAGGGFEVSGDIILKSVDAGTTCSSSVAMGGGVMIYNTDDPEFKSQCVAGTGTGKQCIKSIDFATTTASDVDLRGYQGATYTHLLVFQDRNASSQPAMSTEGNAAMSLSGTIYLPKADFNYHGNGTSSVLDAQVICDEFSVTGNGAINVTYNPDNAVTLHDIGLVQ